MKKFFAGLITGIIIAISFTTYAAVQLKVIPNPYPVFINNTKANVQGYNINGSTYLKLSDLKSAGIDVKFKDSKINVTSLFSAETVPDQSNGDSTVPERGNANNPMNVTRLEDGDNFEKTTYNDYSAIKYNNNTYVNVGDLVKKLKMKFKISGQSNSFNLYDKDGVLILKTTDANIVNYVYYNGTPYLNINLISKYLEN